MTELKWLNFASFLNTCTYGLENPNCPFLQLQQLDQYQKLEWLMRIDEKEAITLIACCKKSRHCCTAPVMQPALKSLERQLVS